MLPSSTPAKDVDQASGPYLQFLRTYLLPQWRRVAVLFVLLVGGVGLELWTPQLLQSFIDTATAGGSLATLTRLALIFLGLACATQVLRVAEAYVAENVGLLATNHLRADLLRHCLHLGPSFHLQHTPGELIERVDGDVATLGNFFGRFVVQIVGNALLLVGVLIILTTIDWRVGIALTVFTFVSLLIINRLRDIGVPYWHAARESHAELFGFVEEHLSGTEDIRSSGAGGYVQRRLAERSRDVLRTQRRAGLMGTVTGSTTIVLFALGAVISLGLGAYLFSVGTITIGTVYLIFFYTELLNRPIEQITRQLQDLQKASASVVRVGELLAVRNAIEDGPGASLAPGPITVEFDHVTFSYHVDEPVLHDVSVRIAPGTVLAVLGRTGSGKTTLTRLLLRFYDVQQGRVCLNGVDIRAMRVADLRRHIGIVTQDIQLFRATVRDNLTFFNGSIADERIVAVLHDLGMGAWYDALPNGLDTMLPPGGSNLSAGQAQLLACARVFLHQPGIVILDEASSRLDPATEHQVEEAVNRLMRGRTGIIIAHRLHTVERANAVLILERGQVVEYGARTVLADDPDSRFAQLLQTGMEEALA
jgi:ABC-type multidrug transport system fused ATPase/permease subunit